MSFRSNGKIFVITVCVSLVVASGCSYLFPPYLPNSNPLSAASFPQPSPTPRSARISPTPKRREEGKPFPIWYPQVPEFSRYLNQSENSSNSFWFPRVESQNRETRGENEQSNWMTFYLRQLPSNYKNKLYPLNFKLCVLEEILVLLVSTLLSSK